MTIVDVNSSSYHVTDSEGRFRGTQALTDNMADRLERKGWHLIPTTRESEMVVTFGTTATNVSR